MSKKVLIPIILICVVIIVVICFLNVDKKETNRNDDNNIQNGIAENNIENTTIIEDQDEAITMIYLKIKNQVLSVELEENQATNELIKKLKDNDITIETRDYGDFEKVGSLGFSLSREDMNITTSAGDIVLYQGNQISIFYGSNSWSYTKLGKIQNIGESKLKEILGDGDVTITFTLSR